MIKNIKIISMLIFVLLVSTLGITKIKAEAYNGKIFMGEKIEGYTYRNKADITFIDYFKRIYRDSDGALVYCVQPFTHFETNEGFEVTADDFLRSGEVPQENWNRISKIAYYGYDYVNEKMGINHTDIKWYVATQMMIWRLSYPGLVGNFTDYIGGPNNENILKDEVAEINYLVDRHNVAPNFTNKPSTMVLGESITLTDINGVFINYDIRNMVNGTASKNGNSLTITATDKGTMTMTLNNDVDRYSEPLKLYYSPNNQDVIRRGNIDPIRIPFNITVIGGEVTLKKIDSETSVQQGEGTLEGAVYGLYKEDGTLITKLTTDSNGLATTGQILNVGKYYFQEETPSTGYNIDLTKYEFDITAENPSVVITVNEDVIKGRIIVNKVDSENGNCNPQGQSSLKGAVFVVKDINGNEVDRMTTNENCKAVSKYLPYGHYKVEEIKESLGYYKNNSTFDINITDNTDYHKTYANTVVKNYISILKQYDFVNGQTTFLNAEEGITFEVYYPNGNLFTEITTDKNGYATYNMPYGVWKFHQKNTTTGFTKIYDFYITVDYDSKLEQYYNILNNSLSAYLQVFKIDSETNKNIALSNTTFKIFNKDKNQYVSQYVGGHVYSEFKTDETGKFTTFLELESGNYKLYEISSPNGYLLDTNGMDFVIGESTNYTYTTYGPIITIYFKNTPIKGRIEINKTGEVFNASNGSFNYDGRVSLEGIEYNIYADEDIKTSDGNYLFYEKGKLISTIITDKNGYAISDYLPLGKYRVVEVNTKDMFKLDETIYHIELTEIDNRTATVYGSYQMVNYLRKGIVEFTKTDLVDSEPIPNTLMELYTENNELIFSGYTDNNGKIVVNDLKIGKYYWLEKEAVSGYLLNTEKLWFEIKEDSEIVKSNMTNEKIKSTIVIHKISSDNDILEGVKIGIYDLSDSLIYEGITDENGDIEVELEYGNYYYKELSTIDGYSINDNKIFFDVIDDKAIIESTLINIKVPITGVSDNYILQIIGILLGLLGIGVIAYAIFKK